MRRRRVVPNESEEPLTFIDACNYPDVGTAVLKVIVSLEAQVKEDRIAVNVD